MSEKRLLRRMGMLAAAAAYCVAARLVLWPWILVINRSVSGLDGSIRLLLAGGVAGVLSILTVNLVLGRFLPPPGVWSGWPGLRKSLRAFSGGAAVGASMSGAVILALLAFGLAEISVQGGAWSSLPLALIPPALALLPPALWEELFFRGYPLGATRRALGALPAIFVTSLLFALAHSAADGYPLGLVNIFLIGLVLAGLRVGRGGLPAAWGAHFAWNAVLLVTGASVSGLGLSPEEVRFSVSGPSWLTGGGFGPEASLITTVAALAAAGALVLFSGRRRQAS